MHHTFRSVNLINRQKLDNMNNEPINTQLVYMFYIYTQSGGTYEPVLGKNQ